MLKKLEDMGQLDNTIVVFTTDNGAEAAYDRSQQFPIKQRIALENEMASLDWDTWGPWWQVHC